MSFMSSKSGRSFTFGFIVLCAISSYIIQAIYRESIVWHWCHLRWAGIVKCGLVTIRPIFSKLLTMVIPLVARNIALSECLHELEIWALFCIDVQTAVKVHVWPYRHGQYLSYRFLILSVLLYVAYVLYALCLCICMLFDDLETMNAVFVLSLNKLNFLAI